MPIALNWLILPGAMTTEWEIVWRGNCFARYSVTAWCTREPMPICIGAACNICVRVFVSPYPKGYIPVHSSLLLDASCSTRTKLGLFFCGHFFLYFFNASTCAGERGMKNKLVFLDRPSSKVKWSIFSLPEYSIRCHPFKPITVIVIFTFYRISSRRLEPFLHVSPYNVSIFFNYISLPWVDSHCVEVFYTRGGVRSFYDI